MFLLAEINLTTQGPLYTCLVEKQPFILSIEKLVTQYIDANEKELPSPEAMKGRVILKVLCLDIK